MEKIMQCEACDADAEPGEKLCAECDDEHGRAAHEEALGDLERRHYEERTELSEWGP